MKQKALLYLGVLLLLAIVVANPSVLGTIGVMDGGDATLPMAHNGPTTDATANVIVIFYSVSDGMLLFWCYGGADIIDNGDTWDVIGSPTTARGVSKTAVAYGYYKYEPIVVEYDEDGSPIPIYIADLILEPITAGDLPKSEHIGKLTAVNPALARPATVTRKYRGQTYNVQCLVTQAVVLMWQSGALQVGDYVMVSFIEEIPGTQEIGVAIVTDKVFESWP